ncbi:MAG: HD domain-containing protein [Aerococcaceae bacterium]|nr:HD domain-containing protein [Aerococcaceae bacterium]
MSLLYDLKNGEEFGIFVLIKSADIRMARNGNPFIAFSFQDRSGSMDGMYWSAKEQEIAAFQAGKVVFLRGERDTYQGAPQIKIKGLRLAETGEPIDPNLYVERIDVKKEELENELKEALFLLREPNIARIVRKILHQTQEDFYTYPAAKRNHHAMAGGLSFHTITMMRIARSLLKVYPQLNPSLLIGGIILHDIGKTIELSGSVSTEYTFKGKLIGHIVLMDEMIDRACHELGISPEEEAVVLLKHVVLAHHGKMEYGSPVVPQLLEAEMIHHIDNMDATMNMITTALAKTEAGHFSEAIYPLERRQIYKPNFKE